MRPWPFDFGTTGLAMIVIDYLNAISCWLSPANGDLDRHEFSNTIQNMSFKRIRSVQLTWAVKFTACGKQNMSPFRGSLYFSALIGSLLMSQVTWAEGLTGPEINAIKMDAFTAAMSHPLSAVQDLATLARLQSSYSNEINHGTIGFAGMNYDVVNERNAFMNKNSCLADLSVQLWLSLIESNKRPQPGANTLPDSFFPLFHASDKPSLLSRPLPAGEEPGSAGWVWQKALALAGQDPDVAISILSVWTHDDIQLSLQLNSAGSLQSSTIQRLRALHSNIEKSYQVIGADMARQAADYQVNFKQDGSLELLGSAMPPEVFIPGSLGESVDIPAELRSRIIQAQAPSAGGQALPAKYYHVYGAASGACVLREEGLSAGVIVALQKRIADIYRSRRLCQDVQTADGFHVEARRRFKNGSVESDNYEAFLFTQARRLLGHPELCADSSSNRDLFCDLIQTHFNGLGALADIDHAIPDAELKSRIHNIFERWQASHLFLQISQAKARGGDYCADRTKVFPDLQAAVLAEQTSPKDAICKILTATQCNRAFAIIRSWEVDFEWTIAQQEAGAKFGASVCHPGVSKQLNERCMEKR